MAGDARRRKSKWDARQGSPDIVEISEDESPPMNKDDHCKDGDVFPSKDSTNMNGNQLGESSSLKPDAFMHQGSAGHEQERTDKYNKDIKESQSKPSSERSQPPRADEQHNNNDWGKLSADKATSIQGTSRYANDRRRGDGWGNARGYSSRIPSDIVIDAWTPSPRDAWRLGSRSPSPRGVWNRPYRNRSGSRSRSRSRERGGGRTRSRSPYFADRGSEWRVERGRIPGGPSLPCRDFAAGRCRRGSHCRFPHEDGERRQFDEPYPGDSRERYGHQTKELMGSREQNDFPRSRQSRGHYDEGAWERSEPRRDYRSNDQCHDFVKGRCMRGASCRFVHDDSASQVGWRDEDRENVHGRDEPDSSYANRTEHRRENRKPCNFFAEGRCRRGQNCPYLHEETPQSQMGPVAPDDPLNYTDRLTTGGSYSKWGEQTNATHANSHILSRDDRENPGSQLNQGSGRSDSRYEYKNQQLEDAGRGQYQIIPREGFSSQGQNKPEIASSQQSQFITPMQTTADSMNNDKVSRTDAQSASVTTSSLNMQTGMHSGNITGQNLGLITRSQDAIPQIPGAPTLPVTTSQLQQSDFSLHPNRQDQFAASQVAANNSAPSIQNQPVAPYMEHNQHGYTLGAQALPDVSLFSGHSFSVDGQIPQNLPKPVYAGESQATIDLTKPSQNSGPHSIQNTHNFQPVASNMHTRNQTFQGLSVVPSQDSGTESIKHTHNFQPVASNMHTQNQTFQGLSVVPSQNSGTQSINHTHNFQPGAPYVQSQSQILQGLSVVPSSSSADMVGAPIPHTAAATSGDVRRAVTYLAQILGPSGLTTGTTGLQSSQPILNPNLMINSSALPAAAQPNPWLWTQQQAGMVQSSHTVPSEQQTPQAYQVPMSAVSSNGNPVLLPHLDVPTDQAAASGVNETTTPSERKKRESKDTEGEAQEDDDNNNKSKDSKALKMFKLALADFVKEALKPTWKEGQLTRDVHKTIVKKVVDKVTSTVENTPQTKEKIDIYMSYSKEKLNKLVQAYVGKYVKT